MDNMGSLDPLDDVPTKRTTINLRAIAFYLPQYHPTRENDEWWGKGFTEWTNVAKAKPQFPGHYQPHLPADLGFYDLRLPELREAQANLARQHGIYGFCYYHYWFSGRRILQRPFDEVLWSGEPDFPFCICWANENWTRTWDGYDKQVLVEQRFSESDDIEHIRSLIPAFADQRYICIDGRPLFLVYRTGLLPDPSKTAHRWREVAKAEGIGELFLARVDSHDTGTVDPRQIGFDAAIEFAPNLGEAAVGGYKFRGPFYAALAHAGLLSKGFIDNMVGDYNASKDYFLNRPEPDFVRFRCVMPSWDNSPRRKPAWILQGASPTSYEEWLRQAIAKTVARYRGDECLIFINAWNEWAESNHLEPDLKWGRAYLEATRRALSDAVRESQRKPSVSGRERRGTAPQSNHAVPIVQGVAQGTVDYALAKRMYWKALARLSRHRRILLQRCRRWLINLRELGELWRYIGRRG